MEKAQPQPYLCEQEFQSPTKLSQTSTFRYQKKMLTGNCSLQEEFNKIVNEYQPSIEHSGYTHVLKYNLTTVQNKKKRSRIIVPTARQGRSQGENGNVDRFLMPRDSFTFRGRNEEGQLSNRAEHLSA